jgi:hypothetical protein
MHDYRRDSIVWHAWFIHMAGYIPYIIYTSFILCRWFWRNRVNPYWNDENYLIRMFDVSDLDAHRHCRALCGLHSSTPETSYCLQSWCTLCTTKIRYHARVLCHPCVIHCNIYHQINLMSFQICNASIGEWYCGFSFVTYLAFCQCLLNTQS